MPEMINVLLIGDDLSKTVLTSMLNDQQHWAIVNLVDRTAVVSDSEIDAIIVDAAMTPDIHALKNSGAPIVGIVDSDLAGRELLVCGADDYLLRATMDGRTLLRSVLYVNERQRRLSLENEYTAAIAIIENMRYELTKLKCEVQSARLIIKRLREKSGEDHAVARPDSLRYSDVGDEVCLERNDRP